MELFIVTKRLFSVNSLDGLTIDAHCGLRCLLTQAWRPHAVGIFSVSDVEGKRRFSPFADHPGSL